jgi:signal transduction histidine kinase
MNDRRKPLAAGAARRLIALLACALLLAAYLAYRAYAAVAQERTLAARGLQSEADFAAFSVATHAGRDLYWGLVDLFGPVVSYDAIRRGGPDVPLGKVVADPCEYFFTCTIRDSIHAWFRIPLPSGVVERSGIRSVDQRSIDSIRARWNDGRPTSDAPFIQIFDAREAGVIAVIAAVVTDSEGRAAAYAFEVPARLYGSSVFRSASEDRPLLPASLHAAGNGADVYAVRLVTRGGFALGGDTVAWGDAGGRVSRFRGRVPLDSGPAGLLGEVGLRPAYVGRRLASVSPSLGMGLVLGTFVLTAMVVGALAVQLIRVIAESRRRADFTASISHELRTPLTQILLYGESLLEGSLRKERDRRQATEVIVREARRLLSLVENLLRFSRAERGAAEEAGAAATAPLSLGGEIRAAVDAFAAVAAVHRARVTTVVDDTLRVAGDAASLRHLITNLLDNAVKHGPEGQTVTIGCRRSGARAELWVEDQGPGVPVRDRQRVWEPFVRLERGGAASVATGSGLGLTVVRQLAEAMEGTVAIEQGEAGGARFVISLPLARALTLHREAQWRAS